MLCIKKDGTKFEVVIGGEIETTLNPWAKERSFTAGMRFYYINDEPVEREEFERRYRAADGGGTYNGPF